MNDQAAKLRELIEHKKILNKEFIDTPLIRNSNRFGAHTIAVTSGKGGVGKTNFTVNLAIALAKLGKKVLVIDADLGLANVEVILGCSSKYTMMNLLSDDISLSEIILDGPEGIKYISGGSGFEQLSDLSPAQREYLLNKLYGCENIADIILIDTGAGIGRNVLDFLIASDEIFLLTTPEPTSLTDAYAVIKAYKAHAAATSVKLIVNKVYDENEGYEVSSKLIATAKKFLDINLIRLGLIYDDRNMVNAIKKQIPLLLSYPDTAAARCITKIAESILNGGSVKVKRGWRYFLQRLIFSR